MSVTVSEINKFSLLAPPQKNGGKEVYYPESDGKPVAETEIHINTIFNLYGILRNYFSDKADVAVIADMMFYYEKGNTRKSIAPDVMVVKGVHKNPRRVFKLWEEKVPDVVFEISSRGTWRDDLQKKYFLYQEFGVKEYYIFDPEYDYLRDGLVAYHLKDGKFEDVKIKEGRIFSPALDLEIVDTGETLRLFNPETKKILPTMEEMESEIEKLKTELAKLKRQN
ncbi:MAG: Uma2 family endonuclease [Acidobacteriota bacterium]